MRKIFLAALFALPVFILIPHMAQFPFQPGAVFSDLLVTHYPNGLYLQRSLAEWKTIPLWSPAILSGYPFGANPLSGLYYLPGWLALLFPLPLGFNLAILLHLVWGGVGMYLFLRAGGRSEGSALLGALTFEAMPKLFSHLGAGHITLIYAVAWTPWLLYAERRSPARRMRVLPGVMLGIIVLADVRWAAYSGLLWLAFSFFCRARPLWPPAALEGVSSGWPQGPRLTRGMMVTQWVLSRLANILVAVLIAAPLLLPLAQYTQLSTRSELTPQESFTNSLPPGQLFGLVYPNIGGPAEWMLYPGAVALALALYGFGLSAARKQSGFWLAVLLACLIFALGSFIPPLEWIARLPGMDLLRVPPRVLFVTGFCFAVLAANGLDHLYLNHANREPGTRDASGLVVFAASAFAVLFAIAAWTVINKPLVRIQFAWGAIFLLAAATIILLARAGKLSHGALTVLALSASLVDLIGVNGLSLDFRPVSSIFSEEGKIFAYLNEQDPGSLFRAYSPSYSLPQHLAAWYRVELADGVDPLQLGAYSRYMEPATGVPFKGYSVTLPPFANENLALVNARYTPDAKKLGLLNVKYLVSAFPIQENGLVLLARFGQTRVYQNELARPRAWVQSPDAPAGEKIQSEPWLVERPNWIVLKAKGPGLLVLSELSYPGWQVTIDGKPAPIETVGELLRGVNLPAGEHEVYFFFRPVLVYAGLVLAALTWAALIFSWRTKGRHSQREIGRSWLHG